MNHLRLPFAYRSISHALKALNVWPVILALTNQEFSRLGFSTATFLVLGTTMPYIKKHRFSKFKRSTRAPIWQKSGTNQNESQLRSKSKLLCFNKQSQKPRTMRILNTQTSPADRLKRFQRSPRIICWNEQLNSKAGNNLTSDFSIHVNWRETTRHLERNSTQYLKLDIYTYRYSY